MNLNLTCQRLREVLGYDEVTGLFRWKVAIGLKIKAGDIAGHLSKSTGYVVIGIDGRRFRAHRLAWLHVHGEWPGPFLDHQNRNKADNRIANLRDLTGSENVQNQMKAHRGSATGVLGVYVSGNRFRSLIKVRRTSIALGTFADIESARAAYMAAKRLYHPAAAA